VRPEFTLEFTSRKWGSLGLCDEIFQVDDRIRCVAHLDENMRLKEMKMRPGIVSLTDEKTDEEFFSLIEPIILGASGKLEKGFGHLKTIRLKYERASIVFFRIPNAVIGISVEPGPTTPIVAKMSQRFKVSLE
jgi:hypothetical protein